MMHGASNLVTILEEEIHVGESLLHNLFLQREAILAWDSSALLARLAEKESLLNSLNNLQARRQNLMAHLPCASNEKKLALNALLTQLPVGPERVALSQLQPRVAEIYRRLRTEEKHLVRLLSNLLDHMQEMLNSLSRSPIHLYGKSGVPSPLRSDSGLIQGKV